MVGDGSDGGVRTEVWIGTRTAAHHRHRLATVGTTHGRGGESRAKRLSALGNVLNGAVDLYGMLAQVSSCHIYCRLLQPVKCPVHVAV